MFVSSYSGFITVVMLAVVLVVSSFVVPILVAWFAGSRIITKTRYWLTVTWWPWVIGGGAIFTAVMWWLAARDVLPVLAAGGADEAPAQMVQVFGGHALVAGGLGLLAGVGLGPLVFAARRRRVALRTLERRLPDVKMQEDVEKARKRAADWSAAGQLRLQMNPRNGKIVGTKQIGRVARWVLGLPVSQRIASSRPGRAPYARHGEWVFGLIQRPTVRTWRERLADKSLVRDWTAKGGRFVKWPEDSSAWRVLLLGEAGAGKTVLLWVWVLCAVMMKAPVVLIDGKGIAADAERLAGMLRKMGRTVQIGGRWNLFTGSAAQITEKIMRVVGESAGEGQFYSDEARDLLDLLQVKAPLRSMQDLETRLIELPRWLSSQSLNDFSAPVDKSGTTKAMRAGAKIRGRMRNLAPFLGEDGWTFDDLGADVRLVPIRPALAAERILGDVMLADLRQWLGALTEPRRMLCVVDEFAQLVSTTTDPGDLAASLAETGRSQGVGLVLAAQSLPGISGDLTFRDRLSSSGIAVVIGRSKSPEAAVSLAGTVKRMEASGDATEGAELNTGRAQDTYAIAPQDVREAWDGAFYLIQGGLHTPFRAIPPEVLTSRPDAYVPAVDVDEEADEGEQPPAAAADAWIGLEVQLQEHSAGRWPATAWPSTAEFIADDEPDPVCVEFTTTATAPAVPVGEWWSSWRPEQETQWGAARHSLPSEWIAACERVVGQARQRYGL
ncbi:hypothetical protein ACR8AL_09350 [Clavibacter sepedonicus]|nr:MULTISPECIES: hypothetical protein [Clavibacter]MBD5382678.1 hypothetical protein [Clavibacter sp.]OQJ45052.1 hypothetical protein B5P19_15785 [Clavibacter sepedonicus]OQJ50925.1 hypothetical protein B5P20_15965 [Clavibacter sepedonicus]UUK67272.1 hypothetical protein LRE50_16060 [Clavibacter sepedonicus]